MDETNPDISAEQFADFIETVEVTAVKAAVITMLVDIYRKQGRASLEKTLIEMGEQTDLGVAPVAVELVVALSAALDMRGV